MRNIFHSPRFSTFAFDLADKAESNGCYSRAANYRTAIRSFIDAVGDLRLRQITSQIVAQYQRHLNGKGLSANTISCYNRCLRAIYNRAVAQSVVVDRRPFADCFVGRARTEKRSICSEYIRKLSRVPIPFGSTLDQTRDFFLFSFYAMGMPFVDVAYLRRNQIEGRTLIYRRRKTGQVVRVPLVLEAMQLIGKYANTGSPYVFPIITATTEPDAYNEYCSRLNAYNRNLKLLARLSGIPVPITSYTVRHSWASIAYKADVPLGVIAQALGHSRPTITMTYIRELDDDTLLQGNQKVLAQINDE